MRCVQPPLVRERRKPRAQSLILPRARPRPIRTAARSARASRHGGRRNTLGRYREHGELRLQLLAVALWTNGLFFAVHEGFKLVLALLANVLKNGHQTTPQIRLSAHGSGLENFPSRAQELLVFKIRRWVFRNPQKIQRLSCRAPFCAAGTCRPSRPSSSRDASICPRQNRGWSKSRPACACVVIAIGRLTAPRP